jgi:hypothetical protein
VGDVNDDGAVDSRDALLILQFNARLVTSLMNAPSADVNRDGRVDAIDAKLVLHYSAGLIHVLPPPR